MFLKKCLMKRKGSCLINRLKKEEAVSRSKSTERLPPLLISLAPSEQPDQQKNSQEKKPARNQQGLKMEQSQKIMVKKKNGRDDSQQYKNKLHMSHP